MPRKFIDLSVSLQEGIKSDPDFMLPKINYHHHNETAEEMISFFPGLKKKIYQEVKDGLWKLSPLALIMAHIWMLLIIIILLWIMGEELLQ